jgi:hypothetical protein
VRERDPMYLPEDGLMRPKHVEKGKTYGISIPRIVQKETKIKHRLIYNMTLKYDVSNYDGPLQVP